MTPDVPLSVAEQMDDCRAAGLDAVAERVNARHWRVSVTTDRVHAYADYRPNQHGAFRWVGGELTIDGRNYPRLDPEDLAEVIDNTDEYLARITFELTPVAIPADPASAPPVVQHSYHNLASKLGTEGVTPQLGKTADGRWIIGVDFNPTSGIRMLYQRIGGRWTLAKKRSIQLIVLGQDYTREVRGDLAKALALASEHLGGTPATPDTPRTASADVKANSVLVRRSTVIRV